MKTFTPLSFKRIIETRRSFVHFNCGGKNRSLISSRRFFDSSLTDYHLFSLLSSRMAWQVVHPFEFRAASQYTLSKARVFLSSFALELLSRWSLKQEFNSRSKYKYIYIYLPVLLIWWLRFRNLNLFSYLYLWRDVTNLSNIRLFDYLRRIFIWKYLEKYCTG